MSVIIAAEHFTLTPTIRSRIVEEVEWLSQPLGPSARVRVFAKRDGDHRFSVVLRIQWRGREWVFEAGGDELYATLASVGDKARRVIVRDKRQSMRRRVQASA